MKIFSRQTLCIGENLKTFFSSTIRHTLRHSYLGQSNSFIIHDLLHKNALLMSCFPTLSFAADMISSFHSSYYIPEYLVSTDKINKAVVQVVGPLTWQQHKFYWSIHTTTKYNARNCQVRPHPALIKSHAYFS